MTRLLAPLILAGSLLAQTLPTTGTVTGRVIDADTGAPLAGVQVGSQATGRVATDADGRYALRNVPPGAVTIFVREMNGGYTNMTLTAPRRVDVVAGRETSGIDFRTRLDAQISGRVLDENGEPLPGIRVSAIERLYPDSGLFSAGGVAPHIVRTVSTDDRGAYLFEDNVFAGHQYYVVAQLPKRYTSALSDVPIDPESRRRVLTPTYYPSAVSLETAVAVVPKSLEHRSDVDIRMRRAPNRCVEATLNSGAALARMRFTIQDEEVPSENLPGNGVPTLGNESGDDGKIRVCDLYPGRFRIVAAQATPTSTALTALAGELPVTIGNADVSGLNVVTLPPIAVPAEIAWERLSVDPSFKTTVAIWQRPSPVSGSTRLTAPSEFTLTALTTLDYNFSIYTPVQPNAPASPPTWYVKDIIYGGSSVLYDSFRARDTSSKLRIILSNDPGSITVTAVRANGMPAASAAILILPARSATETELAATFLEGSADENGVHSVAGIRPGLYYVLATDDPPLSRTLLPSGALRIVKTVENLRLLMRVRGSGQLVEVGPGAAMQVRVTPKSLK